MRIACISASRIPSTTANSMQAMKACQALSQLGHDVHLFAPQGEKQLKSTNLASLYGLKSAFRVTWLPSRPLLHRYDFAFQAARKARQIKANLAYVWFYQAGIFSLLAHLPVILELHGPAEGNFGPLAFRLFQKMPGTKRLLPITMSLARHYHEQFKVNLGDPQLVRVAPNGVDLERYTGLPAPGEARKMLGLPEIFTAGYSGHFYPGRGMDLLLQLAERFPNVHFLWVGGREQDVHNWREQLAGKNISNISLTGFVENTRLPHYQAAADILLMPYERVISGSSGGNSASYASPMKMFEYLACRRAIISSDLPVIREVLNSANAMLCPPGDIKAWSQALNQLVENATTRQSLANQAWLDVQQYTWLERARKALEGFPPDK
jgi:glycosyltransferase involved in cell wall biosynthesis